MKRIKLFVCLILPVSLLGLFAPAAAPAAVDMFLELDGIPGESRDKQHNGEIEVLAWSWGASNRGSSVTRGGAGAGKVSFQDFSLTKYVDSASVPLLMHLSNGQRIRDAELTVRKAGEDPIDFLKFCLTDVGVISLSTGGSGGEDRLTESISLSFASIVQTYVAQSPTGQAGQAFVGGWDLVRNLQLSSSVCDPSS